LRRLRHRLAVALYGDNVPRPTREQLDRARVHAEDELVELERQIEAGPNRHGPAEHAGEGSWR
jgi:ubiquinol-cytochrome c reductase cytochrome b subunit